MNELKKRTIRINLSDGDCEDLVKKCGRHGITVEELIENFIGDLIDGTHTNGSDERMYAESWFDRCWFGMFPEPTLLNHLLNCGYDPEDYLDTLDDIETAMEDKEYLAEHPEEADEEAQYLDDDIESWQEELKDMRADWEPEKEPNMDKELELIKKWVKERRNLKDGNANIDIEILSKRLYSHLCQYSPLKELLKRVNLDGEVFTGVIKFGLEELLNEF